MKSRDTRTQNGTDKGEDIRSTDHPGIDRLMPKTRSDMARPVMEQPVMDREEARLIDRAVGRRIALARHERGMTQIDLGQAVGVTFQQMQKYEKGTNRVSASRLVMIAKALGVEAAMLLPASATAGRESVAILAEAPLSRAALNLARKLDRLGQPALTHIAAFVRAMERKGG